MAQTVTASGASSNADRLRPVRVGLREDLEVSRHVFRGSPTYIVRDPMTFQSQRLDPGDYETLTRITNDRSLGEIFDEMVCRGTLSGEDEERFFEFILSLHSLGFLRLPISDDRQLYQRYRLREKARRRGALTNVLFLRIPLWNPNAFLDRTIGLVRPLLGRAAFIAWLLLVTVAGYVAYHNWKELVNPLQGILTMQNLPLIWATLIGLKVFHELGHAYACKHFGGHVPEMGAYLILFTPCAYMDATASWGFTRKRDRIIVCLAGMYVEAAIAALALFVWSLTEASLVKAVSHNIVFLASATTILFNINPLMRYDGYYVLSDWLEVPNLRQRAGRELAMTLKRWLLKIPRQDGSAEGRLRIELLFFGMGSVLFRVVLLTGIVAVLASRLLLVGVLVGCTLLVTTMGSSIWRLTNYLWYSDETQGRRLRAVALSVVALLMIPSLIMWVPSPSSIQATSWVSREHDVVIRAKTAGFLGRVDAQPGEELKAGEMLLELESDSLADRVIDARSRLKASVVRQNAFAVEHPGKALEEQAGAQAIEATLADTQLRLQDLAVRVPRNGVLAECVRETDIGRYFNEGSPLARIIAGAWRVRALLTAEQWVAARPQVGDRVEFRPALGTAVEFEGVVVRMVPGGSKLIEAEALTQVGGGGITVNPQTREATEAYYEVIIELVPGLESSMSDQARFPVGMVRYGQTGTVRFDGPTEPIGASLTRRIMRFWNKLGEG